MRKLLFISITISLIIVFAAIVHYQWRTHELRGSITHAPEHTASAQEGNIETPVTSPSTLSVETEVTENPNVPVTDVGSAADYEEAFQKFDELYDAFQKEVAAFHKEYQDFEEAMARDTPAKRRSAELQPLLAKAKADAYAAQRAKARALARFSPEELASLDIPLPAERAAELEAAFASDESWDRMEAQHGSLTGFLDYLSAKYNSNGVE